MKKETVTTIVLFVWIESAQFVPWSVIKNRCHSFQFSLEIQFLFFDVFLPFLVSLTMLYSKFPILKPFKITMASINSFKVIKVTQKGASYGLDTLSSLFSFKHSY